MTDEQLAGEQPVLSSVEGAIARLTLNRPEKRNALNEAVIAGLKEKLREASRDERVRVVVTPERYWIFFF